MVKRYMQLVQSGLSVSDALVSGQLWRAQELLEKCNPLGMFDSIATLAVASSMRELYRLVLVDTPLAPYFSESLSAGASRSRCVGLVWRPTNSLCR